MNQIQQLQELINQSSNIVFFTGAGISTESNIPDFRSASGLYHLDYEFPPETILSHHFFLENTTEFYHFYRKNMLFLDALPNVAHLQIAALEHQKKCLGVITQNIDGLHQKAGSKHVIELHGSIYHNQCMECNLPYSIDTIIESSGIPTCCCGGIIKPTVVLYEESLNDSIINHTLAMLSLADLLIVCGTSLSVYPAASFLEYFKGSHVVLLNKTPTAYDSRASLVVHESLGTVFSSLKI